MTEQIRIVSHHPALDLVVVLDVSSEVVTGPELATNWTHDEFANPLLALARQQMTHLNEDATGRTINTSRLVLPLLGGGPEQSVTDRTLVL